MREGSRARIARVASYPSMTGIWQSIKMRSNDPAAAASTASRPSDAIVVRQPSSSSMLRATVWFTGLSSTSRTDAPRAARAVSPGGSCGTPSFAGGVVPSEVRMQSSRADGRTGFVR